MMIKGVCVCVCARGTHEITGLFFFSTQNNGGEGRILFVFLKREI